VQQASKFEFIINLKVAKQIGLTIPVPRARASESTDQMKIGNKQRASGNSSKAKVFGFALCAMLFALCLRVDAQPSTKIPRIGVLIGTTPSD
jgi:hypothetical protein